MNHKGTVTLETERLILRRFAPEDAEAMFRNLHSQIGDSPAALGEFFRVNWLSTYDSPESYQWLIVLKSIGEPIGTMRADGWDMRRASLELGYEVGDRWWHQGIASEAAKRVVKFFFEEVGVRRIAARHGADNPRSGGVALNSGMTLEEAGEDVLLYAILAEEYFNERIISVRDNPSYYERAVDYFSTKWGIERKIYEDSITEAIRTDQPLPRWYLMLRGDTIIGSYGLIENDFMVRKDLMPWLCALYIEESERGKALGAKLLDHGRGEAGKLGFERLYLCTDHEGYYEKYGWEFFGMEESEFGGDTRVYSINTNVSQDFWSAIDKLVSESKVIIDRPKGTKHPRFDVTMPLDYGYLENTSSMDGGGIDVWRGSLNTDSCDALICTVDLFRKDSEIKLLLGCTEGEKEIAMRYHNGFESMKGTMIRRYWKC